MIDFISFGEILFDVFPDGTATLGGAPLNVAGHLSKLGLNGMMLSAVGDDELGKRALSEIEAIGLSTAGIKVLPGKATGRADIVMNGKDADYTFNDPAAWDFLECMTLEESPKVICFGSLAQRSEKNQKALEMLFEASTPQEVFYDVNIRKGFYSKEIIDKSLRYCTILKMNQEEVGIVLDAVGIEDRSIAAVERLARQYNLRTIIITEGNAGTSCYTDETWLHEITEDVPVVDTVGAGDSLSAGFIAALLKTGSAARALRVGSHLADYVVSHRGAIPEYDYELNRYLISERILH